MKKCFVIILLMMIAVVSFSQEVREIKITDLEKIITESKKPLLVNFWATWCIPCIEEIPYFQEEVNKHRSDSLTLLLVSLDFKKQYPDGLSSFIKKRKFTAPVLWLNETNADYFCPKVDEKWSGSIPASLFINNKTGYRKFFEQQLSREELRKEIMAILSSKMN